MKIKLCIVAILSLFIANTAFADQVVRSRRNALREYVVCEDIRSTKICQKSIAKLLRETQTDIRLDGIQEFYEDPIVIDAFYLALNRGIQIALVIKPEQFSSENYFIAQLLSLGGKVFISNKARTRNAYIIIDNKLVIETKIEQSEFIDQHLLLLRSFPQVTIYGNYWFATYKNSREVQFGD